MRNSTGFRQQSRSSKCRAHSRAFTAARAPAQQPKLAHGIQGEATAHPLKLSCVRTCASASDASTAPKSDYRNKAASEISVAVFGATGYIGRKVTEEMVKRGFNVIAVSREASGIGGKNSKQDVMDMFPGATVKFSDVTDADALTRDVFDSPVDVVVSCLASRTGGIKDSWLIDYEATKNCMEAGRNAGASHFVLLSAICVQKPLLEFQKAKLKFEAELQAAGDMTYSIVRPTAFFKSLAGQVESVQKGGPYVMFGDGHLAACKPISEEDLAAFMADCVQKEDKVNKVLPIGGPGEAMDPVQQADVLFKLLDKEPKTLKVPVALMDGIIGVLDFFGKFSNGMKEAAEFGRIGKYYATESMLVLDPESGKYDAASTPSYGTETLEMFFERALRDGLKGQELGDQAVFK